jgi:hypothetical protein
MEIFECQIMRACRRQPGTLRNPRIESTDKLEAKWIRPYVVIEKSRPDTYHL